MEFIFHVIIHAVSIIIGSLVALGAHSEYTDEEYGGDIIDLSGILVGAFVAIGNLYFLAVI